MTFPFEYTFNTLRMELLSAPTVTTYKWQGVNTNPNALRMKELLHSTVQYDVPDDLGLLQQEVEPFLPWADNHFEQERVSGQPINPGKTYKEWRYPASASEHTGFQFNHSYAERYWPQYAGQTLGGAIEASNLVNLRMRPHRGIRHDYGDLGTVVKLLAKDLTTRQAYLPIFHPEDLMAAAKSERVPCSLGYHFICRQGRLDVMYPMRSCDFVRHFRDDVYLTSRLLLWVIKEMKSVSEDPSVQAVVPGRLIMHITSLHCFDSDNLDEL